MDSIMLRRTERTNRKANRRRDEHDDNDRARDSAPTRGCATLINRGFFHLSASSGLFAGPAASAIACKLGRFLLSCQDSQYSRQDYILASIRNRGVAQPG